LITQPPHDEVGRYEVPCSVGQKRDESAGPCTPDGDRGPAGAIDEAGVDGVKHGAAPARVNKVRVPQADPSAAHSSTRARVLVGLGRIGRDRGRLRCEDRLNATGASGRTARSSPGDLYAADSGVKEQQGLDITGSIAL
jgi:hypothetical protein